MKHFENRWIFEAFEEKEDSILKSMFGGLALYHQGQLKFILMENPGDNEYRGKKYSYDIWNGLLVATDQSRHPLLIKTIERLIPHPVLPKWLYLPFTFENWEDDVEKLLRLAHRGDPAIGVWPQEKKKSKIKKKKPASKKRVLKKTKSKSKP